MQIPFWYKIFSGQISFVNFVENYDNSKSGISETFLLATLFGCDPYINDKHFLKMLDEIGKNKKYFEYRFLYWCFRNNETILSGTSRAGYIYDDSFRHINLNLDVDYLYNWLRGILRNLFNVGLFIPNIEKYTPGDKDKLRVSLNFIKQLNTVGYNISEITMDKAYKMYNAYLDIIDLKKIISGEGLPNYFKIYRKDIGVLTNIFFNYWPQVLKSLDMESPFDEGEIKIITEANKKLYNEGDVNFFLEYVKMVSKIFDKDHPIHGSLKFYLESSSDLAKSRCESQLRMLNPWERRKYIPQNFPVSDANLKDFFEKFKEVGLTNALKPYIEENKKFIKNQLFLTGYNLANETIFSNQNSIYLYRFEDLVFYVENRTLYVFLKEDLIKLKPRVNPYNRQTLPESLFLELNLTNKSENLEELWTALLRKQIELEV